MVKIKRNTMSWIDPEHIRRTVQEVRDAEQERRNANLLRIAHKREPSYCKPCSDKIVSSTSATLLDWRDRKGYDINYIVGAVSFYYGVSLEQMKHKTRKREVVTARQVAMYFLRRKTNMSAKSIGLQFGGRDHSTCLHSVQIVNDYIQTDEVFRDNIDKLNRII